MKIIKIMFIFFLLMFNIALAQNYIIEGNSVCVDNTKAFINATPHTLTSSGYVNYELISKLYTGNVNVIIGFNEEEIEPKKIEYNNYILNENGTYSDNYINFNKEFNYIYYDLDNKSKWYYATNIFINKDETYNFRIYFDVKPNTTDKYDLAFYPSSYGVDIIQAYNDGNMLLLDPFINVSINNNGTFYYALEESNFDYIDYYNTANLTTGTIPTRTTGIIDFGQDFEESLNQYLVTGTDVNHQNLYPVISLWVNTESFHDTQYLAGASDSLGWNLFLYTTGKIGFQVKDAVDNNDRWITTTATSIGNWFHILAFYNGIDTQICLNGILDGSQTLNNHDNNIGYLGTSRFVIGDIFDDGSYYVGRSYDGIIDEVYYGNIGNIINCSWAEEIYNLGSPTSLQQAPFGFTEYIDFYNFSIIPPLSNNYNENYTVNININTSYNITNNVNLSWVLNSGLGDVSGNNFYVNGSPFPIIYNIKNMTNYNNNSYKSILQGEDIFYTLNYANETLFETTPHNNKSFNNNIIQVFKLEHNFDINGTFANQEIGNKFYFIFTTQGINNNWQTGYINESYCNSSNWFEFNTNTNTRTNLTGCPDVHFHLSRANNSVYVSLDFMTYGDNPAKKDMVLYSGSNLTNESIFLTSDWINNETIEQLSIIDYNSPFNYSDGLSSYRISNGLTDNNKLSNDSINFTIITAFENISYIQFFNLAGNIKPLSAEILTPVENSIINTSTFIFSWNEFFDPNMDTVTYTIKVYDTVTNFSQTICTTDSLSCLGDLSLLINNRQYKTIIEASDGIAITEVIQDIGFLYLLSTSTPSSTINIDTSIFIYIILFIIYIFLFWLSIKMEDKTIFILFVIYGIFLSMTMLLNFEDYRLIFVVFLGFNIMLAFKGVGKD